AHANLCAHVKKLSNHALDQVRVSPDTLRAFFRAAICFLPLRNSNFRQPRKINQRSHQQKEGGDYQVRTSYHAGFMRAVSGKLLWAHRRQLRRRIFNTGENEHGPQKRGDHGAHGVEGLGKIQPPLRAISRAKNRYIGVGADFQKRLSGGHDEQGQEKKTIGAYQRRRHKQNGSAGTEQQSRQNSSPVADLLHQPPGGKSAEKVATEESDLNKGGLKIAQAKRLLQVRNQNIVQVDSDGPQKEQAGDQAKRPDTFFFRQRHGLALHGSPLAIVALPDCSFIQALTLKLDPDGHIRRPRTSVDR